MCHWEATRVVCGVAERAKWALTERGEREPRGRTNAEEWCEYQGAMFRPVCRAAQVGALCFAYESKVWVRINTEAIGDRLLVEVSRRIVFTHLPTTTTIC